MSLEQDQPYIERTLSGDMKAFSVLVDRYKHMVFTLAVRMVKNREEAEEIAQDTFLKVYNGLAGFKGGSKFSTWVYKITYFRSLDYIKKKGRSLETTLIEAYHEYDHLESDGFVAQLERNEQHHLIRDALKLLPGNDGILITLHYFEELTHKEISVITNSSANTVKVQLFRARKRLAQILAKTLSHEMNDSYEGK